MYKMQILFLGYVVSLGFSTTTFSAHEEPMQVVENYADEADFLEGTAGIIVYLRNFSQNPYLLPEDLQGDLQDYMGFLWNNLLLSPEDIREEIVSKEGTNPKVLRDDIQKLIRFFTAYKNGLDAPLRSTLEKVDRLIADIEVMLAFRGMGL